MTPPRPTLPVFSKSQSSTPLRPSSPASVTTKEGIRSQTMIRASIPAIAAQTARPARMATQVGNGFLIASIQNVMVAPTAAL